MEAAVGLAAIRGLNSVRVLSSVFFCMWDYSLSKVVRPRHRSF